MRGGNGMGFVHLRVYSEYRSLAGLDEPCVPPRVMGTYNLTHYFFSNVGLRPDFCCNGFLNPLELRKVVVGR
jgi:hypothetical protein